MDSVSKDNPSEYWFDGIKYIKSINDMPKGVIGFVYFIKFTDGKMYVGKKGLYKHSSIPEEKFKPGTAVTKIFNRNINGKRVKYLKIKEESNWKIYQGSAKGCKDRTVEKRIILKYCYNNLQLTYEEAKTQFIDNVLEDPNYINDNILGKFYRSAICDVRKKTIDCDTEEM